MTHPVAVHTLPSGVPAPEPRRWLVLALISVAQFMLVLDVTVVNVALPDIGTGLTLPRSTLTWVVTAYTVFFGGLMLLGGRLADAFGTRRLILIGLAVFTAASLASGLAGSAGLLIGGRIGQGIGAALLSPAALATVTTTFHGAERTKALGVWAALGGAGSAVGVLVGGALTAGPGWRWIFFVNVPVGLALLATLPAVLPRHHQRVRTTIDVPGALLVTSATAALIYGMVRAGDTGWSDSPTLIALCAAVLLYGAFAVVERTVATPLIKLSLLGRPAVAGGAFLMLAATGLLIGQFFLGSFYLQHVRGYGPLGTGLSFLPVALGIGVGAHLGSRFVGHLGGRTTSVGGLVIAAAGLGLLTRLGMTGSVYTGLLPGMTIASLGLGAVFVAATTTALATVEHHDSGLTSGLINTFHELGGAIGVAVLSTIAATGLTGGNVAGFADGFWAATATAGVAAVVALFLMPKGRLAVPAGLPVH
ncbi:MFS transporter [Hamadaea sp. NPDC051192]|uniref:MFS transporter n=1 Tax=Hamadaea sp. NPDC051192 TaxID=3154940 RepID=UPI00342A24A7